MSAPPYMKFFWGDYHKATRHLTRDQHGAYFLLIGEAWRLGGSLPDDDRLLAAWALCSASEWAEMKEIITAFFSLRRGKWVHDRVREELAHYEDVSRKRKSAGKRGGSVRAGNNEGNSEAIASQKPTKPEPEPEPEPYISSEPKGSSGERERDEEEGVGGEAGDAEPVRGKVSRRKPETAIPDGYPDDKAIATAQAKIRADGVNLDARLQAEKFRAHAEQNDRRCRDWSGAWRNWIVGAVERAPKSATITSLPTGPKVAAAFDGPPELRASVASFAGEPFAVKYLDQCRWDSVNRTLIAKTGFAADEMRRELRKWLDKNRVAVSVAARSGAAA